MERCFSNYQPVLPTITKLNGRTSVMINGHEARTKNKSKIYSILKNLVTDSNSPNEFLFLTFITNNHQTGRVGNTEYLLAALHATRELQTWVSRPLNKMHFFIV